MSQIRKSVCRKCKHDILILDDGPDVCAVCLAEVRDIEKLGATIPRWTMLAMQVCVPVGCTDAEIIAFAEREHPAGTAHGWTIAEDGNPCLNDHPAVISCEQKVGFVHKILYV